MNLALVDESKELDSEKILPILSYLRFAEYGVGEGTHSELFANSGILPNSPLHWLNPFPSNVAQSGFFSSLQEGAGSTMHVPGTVEGQAVKSYSQIPEVKAIYLSRYGIELQLTVFVSAEKLDDRMLDPLLEKEFALTSPEARDIIAVTYIPGLDTRDIPLVSPNTKLIFYRR